MVEMDFPHPEREAAWHDWYLAHIRVLLTVPGFRASQRFKAVVPMPAPYLALHEVASAALFESPEYRGRGGPASTGEWRDLHTNWQRNLLDGIAATPDVPADAHIVLVRDAPEVELPPGVTITRLHGVGLDRSIEECRLAVVAGDAAPLIALAQRDKRIGVYRPISEKIHAGG